MFRTIQHSTKPFITQQIRFKTIWDNLPKTTEQHSPVLGRITPNEVEQNLSEPLPFSIARKASGMLPVYRQFKNGRTRTVTIIRRVDGNAKYFKRLLSKSIPEDRIKIKLGNVVELNGNYVDVVREWLTLHKF